MDLAAFEHRIGYEFKDRTLLETAFTHRSYLNENRSSHLEHNERLEFLGDAVLELVTTAFLFHKFPDHPEGDLTAYRAALVNTISISEAATTLGINDHLRLSRGEARDTGRARGIILANAFEALLGALYLDGGYEQAKRVIDAYIIPKTDAIVQTRSWQDAKSKFQELAQQHTGITPSYALVEQSGPDHDKHFVIAACIGQERIALGEGSSKQEAQQNAAVKAIQHKGW